MQITNLTITKTKFIDKLLLLEISVLILKIPKIMLLKETENLLPLVANWAIGFLTHNDYQNLTKKRPASTVPNMPEKIPANNRNTSPIVSNAVRNKRPSACMHHRESSQKFDTYYSPRQCGTLLVLPKTALKFSFCVIAMLCKFEEMIAIKNLKKVKTSFDLLWQTLSSWTTISYLH